MKLPGAAVAAPCDVSEESGFTLVELLVVLIVLPLVVGAISVGLISVFSLQGGVTSRFADSGDAQVVSANFVKDVQSASQLTTVSSSTGPAPCGSSSQLLGLLWGNGTEVSYVDVPESTGTSTTYSLFRYVCQGGVTATPAQTSVVSHDMPNPSGQPDPVVISPSASNTAAASGWISAQGVTAVTFGITEPGSKYAYTLTGLPSASTPASQASNLATPLTTTCGAATLGTGTYASTLCFVDFTSYSATQAASPLCQKMAAGITGTPYTLTFCLSVAGGAVVPATIPTYFDPPTSEAFLGNNGFYTGIPGNPALYQHTESTTTTVTITNIAVLDSNGTPASGWELVSGDAESTDAGESMTWTSNQDLSLLPNSTTSQIGNACAAPTTANPAAIDLTGVGSLSVTCGATVSSDKTGTVMLQAPAPTTMTVQMVGGGLEAMFLGMLLP
jgi:prepilin-type N-terminal cleavage/methylation domain-containing protein